MTGCHQVLSWCSLLWQEEAGLFHSEGHDWGHSTEREGWPELFQCGGVGQGGSVKDREGVCAI